jgi:hypothetical protein
MRSKSFVMESADCQVEHRMSKEGVDLWINVSSKILTGITDFRAMHLDQDILKLYLKSLLIGELADVSPSYWADGMRLKGKDDAKPIFILKAFL